MFNLSGSEIVVILLLALIVLGPEKLPDAMRKAGKTFAELKKLSSGFQDEVRKGFEEPVKEVRQTASAVRKAASFNLDTSTTTRDKTTTIDKTGTSSDPDGTTDKARYNPATDPPPEAPEGSSVAEPRSEEPAAEPRSEEPAVESVADSAVGVDETVDDETALEADRSA